MKLEPWIIFKLFLNFIHSQPESFSKLYFYKKCNTNPISPIHNNKDTFDVPLNGVWVFPTCLLANLIVLPFVLQVQGTLCSVGDC